MQEMNVSYKQLKELPKESYQLLDMRDESNTAYGMIPGAMAVAEDELFSKAKEVIDEKKKPIIYCTKGIFSKEAAEKLREEGLEAFSLEGGYTGWLLSLMKDEQEQEEKKTKQEPEKGKKKELTRTQEIEKSIRKKFHKQLFSRFVKAIKTYDLVQENDKIAICISGGKDSMLMAKLFQELKRHNKFHFDLVFLVMDPGYNEMNRKIIENNAKLLDIPITVFESDIFDAVYEIEKSPCYLCARMRRGYLYSKAKELGCNKIALGHHYDDVIETILMGMLYGAQVQTMMPKLHSTNFEGMELIRPMYLIREDDIKRWRDYNGLHFIQCACKFTDTCTTCNPDGVAKSKRMEVKQLIAKMKEINPYVESNIFKSVENVNLKTIVAYKKDGVKHSFLDTYDDQK
ncbi:ATP-binding protein [Anaerostipes sp. MSJ-23]|uniref:ATP-binding protein n=1 Tax=unclassified Anaerostipes TaxID=2635253 RepID=UPI001C0FD629|nr:ATP-binding protein [Anaerostipes sp. MSJ-23]MBU5460529.1 ATPase [Anaerostipes sp. MSJ-23]